MSEESLTPQEIEVAKKYDLTNKIIPFLDRHLVYPVVESLQLTYDQKTVDGLFYELLKDTNIVKFVKEKYESLNPGKEIPKELLEKEEFVNSELVRLEELTNKTLDILSQKEVQENLKQDKSYNREYLSKEHGVTDEKVLELYEFGKFQYNRGDYVMASDLLNNFRVLSTNNKLNISATWGRLVCEILSCEWDLTLEELSKLRELIDSRSFNADPLNQLYQRTWLIHWYLFPFFNLENGLEKLSDLFLSSSYLSTIQASCPWILRYLIAAIVCLYSKQHSSPSYQKKLKDLIRIVSQEEYEYKDPLTEFMKALYIDFDFETAKDKLVEVEIIIKTDFFLSNGATEFVSCARHLISEVYCRVHNRIDLNQLTSSLNLSSKEEGEKWIATLIKDNKLIDAKINESDNTVIMNHTSEIQSNSVYQQIIEKTKGLSFRSNQILMATIQKQE
ncbi:unnamed protein product [[Candida] boidinii]|nr:hypothetical protein BVG19_g3522 [[Candida] boidinii]OWB52780.1 hypothetical protein B5S27_g4361 [[Candida] boidinii]OWB67453.1 hypothetical protein B5S30_g2814 [[Candida] boidinii]OWB84088.1 hypothetical protein B5S33_g2725 [[Candida] boidinii]GME88651.1 unnamed protein product [[Candida] boidinii]